MNKKLITFALMMLLTNVVVNVGIVPYTDEDHPDPIHMNQ